MTFNVVHKPGNYLRLTSDHFKYHSCIFNAIDRIVTTDIPIYCLDDYLDEKDYIFLQEHMGVTRLIPGHKRHTTVLKTIRFPGNMISHAVSMTAVNNTDETIPLLKETDIYKVYFVLGSDSEPGKVKPFVNTTRYPVTLHSHDFIPYVYSRTDINSTWQYNEDKSKQIKERLKDIFVYNEHQLTVEHKKKVLVITKPTLFNGREHPRANTCITRYQWKANPKITEHIPLIYDDYRLRRKIEGEYDIKEIFLLDIENPIEGEEHKYYWQNKFGCPYGVELLLKYNGKLSCIDSVNRAIHILIESMNTIEQEISKGQLSEIIGQEEQEINEQILIIPKHETHVFNAQQDETYRLLSDDSILHYLSIKIMQVIDRVIGEDMEKWENTSIYYKIPHRLRVRSELHVKIPDDAEFIVNLKKEMTYTMSQTGSNFVNELIKFSINECKKELHEILDEINK